MVAPFSVFYLETDQVLHEPVLYLCWCVGEVLCEICECAHSLERLKHTWLNRMSAERWCDFFEMLTEGIGLWLCPSRHCLQQVAEQQCLYDCQEECGRAGHAVPIPEAHQWHLDFGWTPYPTRKPQLHGKAFLGMSDWIRAGEEELFFSFLLSTLEELLEELSPEMPETSHH